MSKRQSAAAALLIASMSCGAADSEAPRWFQVEMLVFANLSAAHTKTETWPQVPGVADTTEAMSLAEFGHKANLGATTGPRPSLTDVAPAAEPPPPDPTVSQAVVLEEPFVQLPPDDLQLAQVHQRLKKSDAYRPLMHLAWRQPALDQENAVAVAIRSPKRAAFTVSLAALPDPQADGDMANDSMETALQQMQRLRASPVSGGITEVAPLQGIARLWVARYLHLDVDLVYRRLGMVEAERGDTLERAGEDGVPTESSEPAPLREVLQQFRMQQTRRMRSRELHFFDHPALGVLAVVVPYTPPIEEPVPEAIPLPAPGAPEDRPSAAAPAG